MKRKIFCFILIMISYLCQTTIFQALSFGSVIPNFLLMLSCIYGFVRGKKAGVFMGFAAGFMADVTSGGIIGVHSLLFMYAGYVNGLFHKEYVKEEMMVPLGLVAASDIVYGFIIYLFYFLLRGRLNILFYVTHIMIPEMVYTVFITTIVYRFIYHISRELEVSEKRRAKKFV